MQIQVVEGNALAVRADVLALKCADGFHGLASEAARIVRQEELVAAGRVLIKRVPNFPFSAIWFFGVGPLTQFRYEQIQEFGRRVVHQAAVDNEFEPVVHHVAVTSHGAGYGLDDGEAFKALVSGLTEGARTMRGEGPDTITIVERSARRAQLFQRLLSELGGGRPDATVVDQTAVSESLAQSVGRASEEKPKLFAAMPFDEKYFDEYQIAFHEAAEKNGFLCERLDLATYVGEVVTEIKTRISSSSGVVALLNDNNPNVFLEIGYAWAKEKPTILVIRRGEKAPFDVQGHRYLDYGSISELRSKLTTALEELKARGVLQIT